jgi:hypothetical protein
MENKNNDQEKIQFLLGRIGGALPIIILFIMLALMSIFGYTCGKHF